MDVLVVLFIGIAALFVLASIICHMDGKPFCGLCMNFTAVCIISSVAMAVL